MAGGGLLKAPSRVMSFPDTSNWVKLGSYRVAVEGAPSEKTAPGNDHRGQFLVLINYFRRSPLTASKR